MTSPNRKNLTVAVIVTGILALGAVMTIAPAYARDRMNDEQFEDDDFDIEQAIMEMDMFDKSLKVVDRITQITADKSRSGVAAVMGLEEHFEEPEQLLGMLESLLKQSDDPQVRRAIRFKLAEYYGDTEQPDKAQEQLAALILGGAIAR